ncbi:MAG: hypothetical protein K6T62_06695, partial [Alicyclobacillus sp.]|nr:hypothetical protein [Alicyclobacillus sp.]
MVDQPLLQPAEDVGPDLFAAGLVEEFVACAWVQPQAHVVYASPSQGVGESLDAPSTVAHGIVGAG